MQQFRPLPRFDQGEEVDVADEGPLVPSQIPTSTTDPIPALPLYTTTGRVPVVLLSGPHPTSDTDRLAALARQPAPAPLSLTSALQATMNAGSTTNRFMVIHA